MPYDIYFSSDDNNYRYAVGTTGGKTLYFIGITPAEGTNGAPDQVMMSIKTKATNAGYGSHMILNIYPERNTNLKIGKNKNMEHHKLNLKHILDLIEDGSDIWAAWGDLEDKKFNRFWLEECKDEIVSEIKNKKKINWLATSLTHKKNPKYPKLGDEFLKPFLGYDIDNSKLYSFKKNNQPNINNSQKSNSPVPFSSDVDLYEEIAQSVLKDEIPDDYKVDKFEIINKAFRTMLPPLSLYIGNTLIDKDRANWWTRFVISKLSESAVSNLPQNGNFEDLVKSLDIQACLSLIINNWKEIFQKKLNNNHLNWAHELKTLRNDIDAHYTSKTLETFNDKALERGIDTMALFMEPINKDISIEIKQLVYP
jgi:hypothetical protein